MCLVRYSVFNVSFSVVVCFFLDLVFSLCVILFIIGRFGIVVSIFLVEICLFVVIVELFLIVVINELMLILFSIWDVVLVVVWCNRCLSIVCLWFFLLDLNFSLLCSMLIIVFKLIIWVIGFVFFSIVLWCWVVVVMVLVVVMVNCVDILECWLIEWDFCR